MSDWYIILSLFPGLFIAFLFYLYVDRYEKEPTGPVILSFMLGMVASAITYLLEEYLSNMFPQVQTKLWSAFVFALLGVSFVEEVTKIMVFWAYPKRIEAFNEPLDGIIYFVIIAMGFATVENILYGAIYGLETILIRSITAVPAHGIFGVMIGYAFGMQKFSHLDRKQALYIIGYAILLHGVYDFFIIQNTSDYLLIGALFALGFGIWISLRYIRRAQDLTPFKNPSA